MVERRADVPVLGGLKRFLENRPPPRLGEACEMCRASIPDDHAHVVNLEDRALMCACRACFLLFTHEGAARGRYRAVPDRFARAPVGLTDAHWDALQIPVGIAFFFFNSSLGRTVAFYPSPAGATESELPLETWEELSREQPLLAGLTADVEALLVSRGVAGYEGYLVPITSCYELVAVIRKHWRGFDGGEQARREIAAFFDRLRERCAGPPGGGGGWVS